MRQPSQIEAVFAEIGRSRMDGMGLLHPALSVEAVGFERGNGPSADEPGWGGILITPWCMNLFWWPDDPGHAAQPGQSRRHRLGGEEFSFIGAAEPELGRFECCSLFSPMQEFADQAQARDTAGAVLAQLRSTTVAPASRSAPADAPPMPSRRALFTGRIASAGSRS
jgi:[NiFe] hydrogenase assembly HybE family chaperone